MARGDVVSDIQSIATGANLDFQPAAGVEVMITDIGGSLGVGTIPNVTPDCSVALWDGSLVSTVRRSSSPPWHPMKIFINNTVRLRLNNTNASTHSLSYCGIQTK